ncbi:PrgI family protein [Candidatus Nomurabacteria bacterium]|nr:PrgI family protein [Candidatus Nomurabacteria bacterium]
MQFKVPQFIDIEDKVVGNLSFRQFAYLAGGAGLAYISVKVLPTILALVLTPALIGLSLALTFVKINEKPFSHILESFIRYYTKSRLYLWKKQEPKVRKNNKEEQAPLRATLSESKLKTLSWSLDVIDPKK